MPTALEGEGLATVTMSQPAITATLRFMVYRLVDGMRVLDGLYWVLNNILDVVFAKKKK